MPHNATSTTRLTGSRLANLGARVIFSAFNTYRKKFKAITRRSQERFERRDWRGVQTDAAERLDLYKAVVDRLEMDLRELLDDRVQEKLIWAGIKAVYSSLITELEDWELAETFFNSATRRIFATVGVDPQIEFVDTDFETPPTSARHPVYRTYDHISALPELVKIMLKDYPFRTPYEDLDRDARLVAEKVEAHLRRIGALRVVERTEMIRSVFYRGKGAYLIGRMFSGSHMFPFVLALHHSPTGIFVDAVLLTESEVSILFSFTRSYFHVEVDRPYDLVRFLKTFMPRKRIAELYISLGFNKHGKTELYRDLLNYLSLSDDKFEIARGKKGMVMIVFTMPGYDLVFKVIRDRFAYPKRVTRQEVMSKYHLVFKHDRAGRLVDAQEFEHLKFDRRRFSEELLEELQRDASRTVSIDGEHVIIHHAYVERRMIPLDIYVEEADMEAAVEAVIDYGNAIKDMACTNIFPGDMMLKNFGVTRHGRVIFYDYDELCLLTECNFRHPPRPPDPEMELSDEPWFVVGEHDIFPTEFPHFIELRGELREVFFRYHGDLFEVEFWRRIQEQIREGKIIHIFPYHQSKRLRDVPVD